jgi:DNA-binding transcriptional ArsR family regulator
MDDFKEIIDFDRLIHEPSRLAIMALLSSCNEADFTYLLNATNISKGNLSAQLKKLNNAGYIDIIKSFKGSYPNTSCKLTAEGKRAFNEYRKKYLKVAQSLKNE